MIFSRRSLRYTVVGESGRSLGGAESCLERDDAVSDDEDEDDADSDVDDEDSDEDDADVDELILTV